jgi:hypothetical protein
VGDQEAGLDALADEAHVRASLHLRRDRHDLAHVLHNTAPLRIASSIRSSVRLRRAPGQKTPDYRKFAGLIHQVRAPALELLDGVSPLLDHLVEIARTRASSSSMRSSTSTR